MYRPTTMVPMDPRSAILADIRRVRGELAELLEFVEKYGETESIYRTNQLAAMEAELDELVAILAEIPTAPVKASAHNRLLGWVKLKLSRVRLIQPR